MTESPAICHYLVEKYGPTDIAVYPDEAGYGEYVNWLYRSDATLTFPLTIVLRYTRLEPEERQLPQAAEDYAIWYFSRLRCVETALEGDKEFLVNDRFTIADITTIAGLGFADFAKVDIPADLTALQEWRARVSERPSVAP